MNIFWDVDTQNDFMNANGKLYVNEAEEIKKKLKYATPLTPALSFVRSPPIFSSREVRLTLAN